MFAVIYVLALHFARRGVLPFVLRYLPRRTTQADDTAAPLPRRRMPEPGTPLLAVDRMIKRFGGLEAVSQVGFTIAAGEIVGLIGPNGAGKSTLFNLRHRGAAKRRRHCRLSRTGHYPLRSAAHRAGRHRAAPSARETSLRACRLIDNVLLGTYLRTRSGFLGGALRLDRAEEARARGEALRQLERVGLANSADELPAICRLAVSASSKSPARSPPIRPLSSSTNRPPV